MKHVWKVIKKIGRIVLGVLLIPVYIVAIPIFIVLLMIKNGLSLKDSFRYISFSWGTSKDEEEEYDEYDDQFFGKKES